MRKDDAARSTPRERARRRLEAVANNPQRGDKVRNRSALDHQTRRVVDRFFGGDVHYCYDSRSKYMARCTLEEWKIFVLMGRATAESI